MVLTAWRPAGQHVGPEEPGSPGTSRGLRPRPLPGPALTAAAARGCCSSPLSLAPIVGTGHVVTATAGRLCLPGSAELGAGSAMAPGLCPSAVSPSLRHSPPRTMGACHLSQNNQGRDFRADVPHCRWAGVRARGLRATLGPPHAGAKPQLQAWIGWPFCPHVRRFLGSGHGVRCREVAAVGPARPPPPGRGPCEASELVTGVPAGRAAFSFSPARDSARTWDLKPKSRSALASTLPAPNPPSGVAVAMWAAVFAAAQVKTSWKAEERWTFLCVWHSVHDVGTTSSSNPEAWP